MSKKPIKPVSDKLHPLNHPKNKGVTKMSVSNTPNRENTSDGMDIVYQRLRNMISLMYEGEYAEPNDMLLLLDQVWGEFLKTRMERDNLTHGREVLPPTKYVLEEVSTERAYQKILYSEDKDVGNSVQDWVAVLTRHLGLASSDSDTDTNSPHVSQVDYARFRRQMMRVAAIAVAAVEATDRKSDVKSKNLEYNKGSGV